MPKTKLSVQDFITKAIAAGKDGKHKGIHVVYSGFNAAFRQYFDNADPRAAVDGLVERGVLASRGARGGAIIYMAADAPEKKDDKAGKLLASMGV